MKKLTEFVGVKMSAADLRRLEMILQLQRVSKSRFVRGAIAEAVRQGFVAEVEQFPKGSASPTTFSSH